MTFTPNDLLRLAQRAQQACDKHIEVCGWQPGNTPCPGHQAARLLIVACTPERIARLCEMLAAVDRGENKVGVHYADPMHTDLDQPQEGGK